MKTNCKYKNDIVPVCVSRIIGVANDELQEKFVMFNDGRYGVLQEDWQVSGIDAEHFEKVYPTFCANCKNVPVINTIYRFDEGILKPILPPIEQSDLLVSPYYDENGEVRFIISASSERINDGIACTFGTTASFNWDYQNNGTIIGEISGVIQDISYAEKVGVRIPYKAINENEQDDLLFIIASAFVGIYDKVFIHDIEPTEFDIHNDYYVSSVQFNRLDKIVHIEITCKQTGQVVFRK